MTFQYQAEPKVQMPCPACGGDAFESLANVDRYRMGLNTVSCRACRMITTNPVLTEDGLNKFYRDNYRELYSKVGRPSEEYIAKNHIGVRARYTATFINENVNLRSGGRILDVGCAEGSLLRAISLIKPECAIVGVEPGPFAEFARTYAGCEVVGRLEDVPETPFDLVLVNHVLEHIRDPLPFLQALRDRLQPTGIIYVDVPDASAYSSVDDLHLAHLHHFTQGSLSLLAARAGLRVLKAERHYPPSHPVSIRALMSMSGAAQTSKSHQVQDEEAAHRIRRIGATSPWATLMRSRVAKTGRGVARRIHRAVLASRSVR